MTFQRKNTGRLDADARASSWQPPGCQWLEGDPRDRNFCNLPVKEDSSYCEEHHKRCYTGLRSNGEAV